MSDDPANEDQWLYGDSNPDQNEEVEKSIPPEDISDSFSKTVLPDEKLPSESFETPFNQDEDNSKNENNENQSEENEQLQTDDPMNNHEPLVPDENGEAHGEGGGEFDDDDDSDDDVNVVIGDIKTAPQYSSLNIKRGGLLTSATVPPQLKQPGKFSIDEFETIGVINGVAAHEFNLDNLEDKPWRKPGADITDYFNYGFNEETWRAYCERQKRMRVHESGVGLGPIGTAATTGMVTINRGNLTMPIVNDNSKYVVPGVGASLMRKAGPPPGRRVAGAIDVIGGTGLASRRTNESPPKENIIQVMTADRREYSRKGYPDVTVPPPGVTPGFPIETPPPHIPAAATFEANFTQEFYQGDDPYYNAYEPTQDLQWGARDASRKSGGSPIKDSLEGVKIKQEPESPERSRQRDRERDRHRERSHRHRTRSRTPERRSRKHKSRSRSPSHRHKKKKSKKSDRDRSKDETSD
uniref:Pre-mRNA polyadenylation factor Fip1 domain-containing protein n=1 Tax=Clastoptera arizonana TaxID=38151 RepID=A0A1B6DF78_9HEMI